MSNCIRYRDVYGLVINTDPAWNGYAVSNPELSNPGYFSWGVTRSSVGVVVGLDSVIRREIFTVEGVRYDAHLQIPNAFWFSRGRYTILEAGVRRGAWHDFSVGDTFHLHFADGVVSYCVQAAGQGPTTHNGVVYPGTVVRQAPGIAPAGMRLAAVLYSVGDAVTFAGVSEANPARAGGEIAMGGIGSDVVPGTASGVFSLSGAALGTGSTFCRLRMTLGGAAGEAAPGAASGALRMEGQAEGRRLVVVRGAFSLAGVAGQGTLQRAVGRFALRGSVEEALGEAYAYAGGLLRLQGALTGRQVFPSRAHGRVSLWGYAGSAVARAMGNLVLGGLVAGARRQVSSIFVQLPRMSGNVLGPSDRLVRARAGAEADMRFRRAVALMERVRIVRADEVFSQASADVLDKAGAASRLRLAFVQELMLEVAAQESISERHAAALLEKIRAQPFITSTFSAVSLLLDAVNVAAYLRDAPAASITSRVEADSGRLIALRTDKALSALQAVAHTENTLTAVVISKSVIQAGDKAAATAQFISHLASGAAVSIAFKLNDELSQTWVMNTDKSMPLSRYENYDFTSYATIGGVDFATRDDGIYRLDGDSDNGDKIAAALKTMVLDFGASEQKRIVSAYVGYTSSGKVLLRVRAVDGGRLQEHIYEAKPVTADAPRANKIPVGAGLRSRYWQFVLENVDGADFHLDEIEFITLKLGRRV